MTRFSHGVEALWAGVVMRHTAGLLGRSVAEMGVPARSATGVEGPASVGPGRLGQVLW